MKRKKIIYLKIIEMRKAKKKKLKKNINPCNMD